MRDWLNAISAAEPAIKSNVSSPRSAAIRASLMIAVTRSARPLRRRPQEPPSYQSPSAISAGGASVNPIRCLFRSAVLSTRLRSRTDFGVTSTSSSSSIHSSAASRVVARGAHVGELLFTAYVDRQIYLARILADDHPFVNRLAGTDEEYTALLQMEDRVGSGETFAIGNHRSVGARP